MTVFQAILLGIIQGITEFLPISSSGHLVIVPFLLGWDFPAEQIFPFDVLIQFSTLIAVIAYYWGDLIQIGTAMVKGLEAKKPFAEIEAKTGWFALFATVPAGLVGLLFKEQIETVFSRPDIASILLIGTAILILFSEKFGKKTRKINSLTWLDAIVIGISQALAIFPGISRSGSTISGGLVRNLDRKTAGQFAFLMAIPIMAAAGLLSIFDLIRIPNLSQFLPVLLVGFFTSGIVGFFSIRWLLNYLANHSLIPFAIYCLILGSGSFILSSSGLNTYSNGNIGEVKDVYHVTYSSSIEWIIPDINKCSDKFPEAMFFIDQANEPVSFDKSNIHFSYDELTSNLNFTYQLGIDSLSVGVNSNSAISQLTSGELRQIYQGEITSTSDLQKRCEACTDGNIDNITEVSYRLWGHPGNSFLEDSIQKVFNLQYFSPGMFIAPNPSLMKEAVLLEESAIGIFPNNLIDDHLKTIPIVDLSNEENHLTIIASSQEQPTPFIEGFIICIQENIN